MLGGGLVSNQLPAHQGSTPSEGPDWRCPSSSQGTWRSSGEGTSGWLSSPRLIPGSRRPSRVSTPSSTNSNVTFCCFLGISFLTKCVFPAAELSRWLEYEPLLLMKDSPHAEGGRWKMTSSSLRWEAAHGALKIQWPDGPGHTCPRGHGWRTPPPGANPPSAFLPLC